MSSHKVCKRIFLLVKVMAFQEKHVFMKELISVASSLPLLPKDLFVVSKKLGRKIYELFCKLHQVVSI